MQFSKIELQNFMSYKKETFPLGEPSLVLIEGKNLDDGDSNGAGKSSIWDGISWAIFGATVRGLKADEVINRKFGADCFVGVSFEAHGKNYRVERYRKHSEYGDRFRVVVDGDVTEMGTTAATQEWLEKTLGIDFDLFRCTVLFAQGETFNFVNAGNKSQKEILSKVMRVDYASYLDRTKAKRNELQDEKMECERKIAVLESHVVENPEDSFSAEIAEWESERKAKIEELHKEAEKLAWKKDDLELKLKDSSKLDEITAKLKEQCQKIADHIQKITEKIAQLEALNSTAVNRINSMTKLSRVAECPMCEQEVDSGHITKHLEALTTEVREREGTIAELRIKKTFAVEKRTENEEKIDKVREKIAEQREIKAQFNAAVEAMKGVDRRVKEEKERENPYTRQREEAIEKQKQIAGKLAALKKSFKEIEDKLPYYEFFVTAFGDNGIKSFVFDLICSTLTSKANKYLNILTGGAITVSFDTQKKLKTGEYREKFECSVITSGKPVPYDAYSGGEKRRVSLAVDMALSDLMGDYYGSKFNTVVFDEQTNYLDRAGRQAFMRLLKDIAKNRRVYVVDHDSEFKALFDEVITIEKKSGISRVVA